MSQLYVINDSSTALSNLHWPLSFVLGAVALIGPRLSILGYSQDRAWLSILATTFIMVIFQSKRADLLDAVGMGKSWTFELRFPTHEALSEF